MKMNTQNGRDAQAQPGGSDDLAELERTRQAYQAARKRLGMSYAPRVAAGVVGGLLIFALGAGGMFLLTSDAMADSRKGVDTIADLKDELKKTKDELKDSEAKVDELKAENATLKSENEATEGKDDASSAAKKDDDSDSAGKSAAYDPTSFAGTWTGDFKETNALYGENCLFGRNNPVKLVVKTWDPDTGIFDGDLTIAYHGHDTSRIKAQTQTVPGDAVKEFKDISGTIDEFGRANWTFDIDNNGSKDSVDVYLEVEGVGAGPLSATMTVTTHADGGRDWLEDEYELIHS